MRKKIILGLIGCSLIFGGCQNSTDINIASKNQEEQELKAYEKLYEAKDYLQLVKDYKIEPIYYFEDDYGSLFQEIRDYYNNENKTDISVEEFKEELYVDSSTIIYDVDINNDDEKELVFASLGRGTGHFSGIDFVFKIVEENGEKKLRQLEVPEIIFGEEAIAHFIDILNVDGEIIVKLTDFDNIDTLYLWKDNVEVIFTEKDFVNNDHLELSNIEGDERIKIEYDINNALEVLKEKSIDYTVSGYSNEEILLSYFKIIDYIASNEKEKLSELIVYPLVYYPEGTDDLSKIFTKEEFLEHYDEFITENIKKICQESKYDELFSSWKGNMIGDGQIWFGKYILSINDF